MGSFGNCLLVPSFDAKSSDSPLNIVVKSACKLSGRGRARRWVEIGREERSERTVQKLGRKHVSCLCACVQLLSFSRRLKVLMRYLVMANGRLTRGGADPRSDAFGVEPSSVMTGSGVLDDEDSDLDATAALAEVSMSGGGAQ